MTIQAQALKVGHDGRSVVDAIGVSHPVCYEPQRIVSLVPSITELLCELGLASQIVGRTGFCIHPKETVTKITKVGGTKDVNIKKIRALNPSHAIVNIDENEKELYDELTQFIPNVFVTHPLTPHDNLDLFRSLGTLFNASEATSRLVSQYKLGEQRIRALPAAKTTRVLYLIWKDPWMIVSQDTYIAQMLGLIHWEVICLDRLARYPQVKLEDYVGAVDKVLLSSEPYSFRQKHVAEVQAIFGETVDVLLVDGEMLSWYGSRAILGLDYLHALAHR